MFLDEVKVNLIEARNNVLQGRVNCIPWPFRRFREEVPGIRKKFYYLISGATKSSKTQITNYIFIINSVFYYIHNPNKIKPTIHVFPLEETKEDIYLRIYAFVLNYISKGRLHLSPEELESIDERKPLPQEVLTIMNSKEFIDIIKVFEECLIFHEERNATGIYKAVKTYLDETGHYTYIDKEVTYRDDMTRELVTKMVHKRDTYVPNNPYEYVMFIVDHVGLLQCEVNNGRLQTLKEAIEKLSEYCVVLRNEYSAIPIIVQQQNSK